MEKNSAFIAGEFINLYSRENPILETDNICHFLLFNSIDYHRPLRAKGLIVEDKFVDGMNKNYYIKLMELNEPPKVLSEFVYGKDFFVNPMFNNVAQNRKIVTISENFDFSKNLFKIEAFFVRETEEQIKELFIEYISIIKKDIKKQLLDIENCVF
jgi:hypothetical protein